MAQESMVSHIAETLTLLEQVFTHYQKVVVWYSSGKDSTTLMHLLRPWASQVTVLSVIMDNGWPGCLEHVERTCAEWGFERLQILAPPISFPHYVQQYGWPSQLVPTSMNGEMPDPFYDGGPRLASWWHCSVLRVVLPLVQATQELKADAVLTAARKSDAPAHARIGAVIEAHDVAFAGWSRFDLLHQWTTAQVWEYIDSHGITLPAVYKWKRHMMTEAPDCVECPFNSQYMHWAKKHEPEIFARIMSGFRPALARMRSLATQELATWEGIED